jgi:hypothetical protein
VFLCATYRDDQTHQRFVIGMNISLGILAFLSSLLGETFVSFYTDKKEIKFSSYIRKFRVEQLQSHI